ncbi:MAG: NAD(P)-binding domain-containing protein [Acholeplasmataceae bacterium]|nr:NAD(P)-binding domain-containing protein [Acholeplasmataceae bacterium]
MRKVYCLNNISKIGLKALSSDYQVIDSIGSADAVLVRSAAMHDMELPDSVLVVARAGAGVNNIPLEIYDKKGVVVFNTPGANANAVKELTLAGMLIATRDIHGGLKWIEENKHDEQIGKSVEIAKVQFGGTEIFGKTIGIIGLGAIGSMLAKACNALGMKVYGNERNLDSLDSIRDTLPSDMVLVKSKEELFPLCDFISLNLPLTPETKHMINLDAFKQMKDGVILLNFARDALVNDDDLKEAISIGKVRKYVTDFPNHQTVNSEGVIAIPHLGASTEEAEDNCATMAAMQIENYLEHGNIKNSVNFPDMDAGICESGHRLSVLMLEDQLTVHQIKLALESSNEIKSMIHRNKKGFGYVLIDLEDAVTMDVISKLQSMSKILRVRVIK